MPNRLRKELEQVDEVKCYEFSWELKGYDCGQPKIRSPIFTVDFQVTDWYIELDISKLQNINSTIPFRLQRIQGVGPTAVTLDVKITVKLGENKDFTLEKSQTAKVFSEAMENYWAFDIDIPSRKLEFKAFDDLSWLNSKNIFINIEMKSSNKIDPVFPKRYWNSEDSLVYVLNGLKKLHDEGLYHDLVLKVSGEEFKLHKCILNARWPNFVSSLKISESCNEVVTNGISDVSPTMLKYFLRFAYFGELDFMSSSNKEVDDVFDLVRKYNFYRLNDKITQLSPKCSSSQFLQSYRTTIEMRFKNVTSTEEPMGVFKTCDIPLKPRRLPTPSESKTAKEMEKFHQHIRFLDVKLYVDKGPLGYNWLMFSLVLGKLPQEFPVIMKCKLYVVGENKILHLLTEKYLVFDRSSEISFSLPINEGKVYKRYQKVSEPIITWRELTDESMNLMRTRHVMSAKDNEVLVEKDLHFRFELKLADGEQACNTKHGECEWKNYQGDYKIFKDLELVYNNEKFTDIKVTSDDRFIKAHKAILAARSKVLEAVLREKPDLKVLNINIQADNLHLFVHYIYTGQLHEIPMTIKKLGDLVSVAEEYKMECLKEILTRRMKLQQLLEPDMDAA